MSAVAPYEVDAAARLRGARVFGIDQVVVESVAELGQMVGDSVPKGALVYAARFNDVFKDEGKRFEVGNAFEADFCRCASAFVVVDSLLFAEPRFGLARESRDVEVNSRVVDYFGFGSRRLVGFPGARNFAT